MQIAIENASFTTGTTGVLSIREKIESHTKQN